MTEGQDATATPMSWSGAGRPVPPALALPDRSQAKAGVALSGIAAADLPAATSDYAAAPVPATGTSAPDRPASSLQQGGTGWPGPDSGQQDAPQQDAAQPDAARPDAARPDAARPDAGQPAAGSPQAQPGRARSGRGRHSQAQPAAGSDSQASQTPGAPGWPQVEPASQPLAAPERRRPKHAGGRPAAGHDQAPASEEQPAAAAAPTGAAASPAESQRAEPGGIWAAGQEPATGRQAARSQSPSAPSRGPRAGDHEDGDAPFARVDARKLEAALLGLRHPIVTVPLLLDAPGVAEARAERVKLLSQIDDYLLPRLRQSGAPILVALVGSTGAGKSTLMNSLVGKQVSNTGIRRPTTNSPVLACHPDDMRWFAENVFLPTLPRVRQQGLAMPGRDGLLVLAASEGMPKGVALLDTPDIDSVVQAHRDFAHQFLDASDLWLFVTTARRYADAAVWEMLKDARDRGAALALALSRVPPSSSAELAAHFDAMLEANGLREVRRFIIPETIVTDAQLPGAIAAPIRDWLADTARREDRRVAVLTQTMSGVLDTFRGRVPALAGHVDEQLVLRRGLRESVDAAYTSGLADFDEATRDGSLLHGEVLARWQDLAGTGDLLRTLQVRRGRGAGKQKKQRMPARAGALKDALQVSLESLVIATADRAAELVVTDWRGQPAGACLLADIDAGSRGGGAANTRDFVTSAMADLGLADGSGHGGSTQDSTALARATAGLAPLADRAVASWQEHVLHLVKEEKVTKRSIARVVAFDDESLALVLSIGVLGYTASDADAGADSVRGASAVSQELLTSLFGAGLLRDIGARVRQDLRDRVSELFEAETRRYLAIIDSAGIPAETAASELLQAGYALEAAR
jgi:GTPase SAR1 family protein